MTYEFKVDGNLYHLQNVLFDLDNYSFDRDIISLLNQLKTLVDKKLYLNLHDGNIVDYNLIFRYKLKK